MARSLRSACWGPALAWALIVGPACGGGSPLSPARSLVGTWTDLVPVNFDISPGSHVSLCCSPSTGGQSCVTSQVEQSNVAFVITAGVDANHVTVEMNSTNGKVVSDSGWYNQGIPPGTTVAPCTPPLADQFGNVTYTGTVSASQLTLSSNVFPNGVTVGTFNLTSSTLTGTFAFTSPDGYAVNESTAANSVNLTLQP